MKRHLTMLLAGATLLLAACTGVDESADALLTERQEPSLAVNFNAYVNRNTTRTTTILDQSSLQTAGFGVFAYYTDSRLYGQTALPDFMYNQQVTYETDQWTYSPVKYWPNETGSTGSYTEADHLTFFAYAPYTAVSPSTGRATDGCTTGITGLSRAIDSGDPIVRYYASMTPSEAVDLCWGTPHIDETKPTVASKIDFNFKHALAALNVQIDADINVVSHPSSSLHEDTRIYVRSITFKGFADKGQLNLYSTSTPQWNNLDCDCDLTASPITIYDGRRDGREGIAESLNERNTGLNPNIIQSGSYSTSPSFTSTTDGVTNTPVNLFDVSGMTLATTEEKAVAPIFVIPTNEPLSITIVYDVETYDSKLVSQYLSDGRTHGSTIENCITANISGITMTAGNKYTIGLHLGMASVKVDASVSEWVVGGSATVELPEN